ncbi:MAG: ferritin-like domain-containing protein [Campylobacterota bacterium]|nr:ferritin-like domain-containing protein [Campylobacterota bacterium]
MNNNFFNKVKEALRAPTPKKKFETFDKVYKNFLDDKLSFEPIDDIEIFTEPAYKDYCKIVPQREVPFRKNLGNDEGQSTLLHSIAHIEYSAIDLALDACYRFPNMPYDYYKDWMEVADDEIRHFNMINDLLETYGVKYSDLPVHQGLFDASMKALELIPRMALIPRYMEANGLDANVMLMNKLKKIKGTEKLIELLEIILEEEVDHVKKGDRWYKYGCSQKENFTCDYFKIVNTVYPNSFKTNKAINVEARKRAGFSQEEIDKLLDY